VLYTAITVRPIPTTVADSVSSDVTRVVAKVIVTWCTDARAADSEVGDVTDDAERHPDVD